MGSRSVRLGARGTLSSGAIHAGSPGEGRRVSRLLTRRSSVDRSPAGAALKAFGTSARAWGIPPSVPARAYGDGRHGAPPARHRGVGVNL